MSLPTSVLSELSPEKLVLSFGQLPFLLPVLVHSFHGKAASVGSDDGNSSGLLLTHPGSYSDALPLYLQRKSGWVASLVMLDAGPGTEYILQTIVRSCMLGNNTFVYFSNLFNYEGFSSVHSELAAWNRHASGLQVEWIGYFGRSCLMRIVANSHCRAIDGNNLPSADVLRTQDDATNGYLAYSLLKSKNACVVSEMFQAARKHFLTAHEVVEDYTPQEQLDDLNFGPLPRFMPAFDMHLYLHCLYHDRDQLKYLLGHSNIADHPKSLALAHIRGLEDIIAKHGGEKRTAQIELSVLEWSKISTLFHRSFHLMRLERVETVMNPLLPTASLSKHYLGSNPSVLVVDDFLSFDALDKLYRYCLESTIFFDVDHKGYSGAYLLDGFASDLMAQFVEELRAAFPDILCSHALKQGWFYKYDDQANSAVNIHADVAAVNFNLWLTPEDNLIDRNSSGLIVYTKVPPDSWEFMHFNSDPTPPEVVQLLKDSNVVHVPYRRNRAVIFQSDLFHASDRMVWRPGYEGRRINLTLLFGEMRAKCSKKVHEKEL